MKKVNPQTYSEYPMIELNHSAKITVLSRSLYEKLCQLKVRADYDNCLTLINSKL